MNDPTTTRDQEELDAQFRLDSIPDIEAVFARRAKASEEASARFKSVRDIRYGPNAGETFNLFPAASGTSPSPVQVFIHGGFWSTLAAADFSFVTPGFVPFGSAVAVIDYPLIPAVRLGDIVRSCLRAIGYLHRDGAAHGIDPERIFVSGNSAGGHLVAEVMDRARLRDAGLPDDVIKGGTAISGLYDLEPVARSFRNELLQITGQEVAEFSPLRRKPDTAAPVIVTVGGDEMPEFIEQTARLAEAYRAGGAYVEHIVVPSTDHLTVVLDAFANPGTPLNLAVRRQMALS
jgi:arylformamidase